MSTKERETLLLLAGGFVATEIAERLQVTTHYVYDLVRLLKVRFGARTIAGLVVQALREGLIDLADIPTRSENEADSGGYGRR